MRFPSPATSLLAVVAIATAGLGSMGCADLTEPAPYIVRETPLPEPEPEPEPEPAAQVAEAPAPPAPNPRGAAAAKALGGMFQAVPKPGSDGPVQRGGG